MCQSCTLRDYNPTPLTTCASDVPRHRFHTLPKIRTTYTCCHCHYHTTLLFPSPPTSKYFLSHLDLSRLCRGGCGHRLCVRCHDTFEVRHSTCWSCGNVQAMADWGNRYNEFNGELVEGPVIRDGPGPYCRDCGMIMGGECVKDWRPVGWVCRWLGECFWGCGKEGERGHFCELRRMAG